MKVVIGQGELTERFTTRLDEFKDQVQLKGFRKGKVPVAHIKKLYGRSVMAEVLQQAVEETSRKALEERKERAAHQPNISLGEDKDELERVLSGQSDLAFTMSYEALPDINLTDLAALKLERPLAEVSEEAIDKAVTSLAERAIRYEVEAELRRATATGSPSTSPAASARRSSRAARARTCSWWSGSALHSGIRRRPGGRQGGRGAHRQREVPRRLSRAKVGRQGRGIPVKVKEVAKAIKPEMNDEFAKTLGAENLAKLREMVAGRIASEYLSVTRMKLKRQILDALDKAHDFALPETLVDDRVRRHLEAADAGPRAGRKTFADEGKNEEEMKAEYRKIAERRVRLGLVIGEIGDKAKVQVGQEELRRALIEQARRYPGQEKVVYEYYEKNPAALIELRAPIFEDKVIEHILEQAKPVDKKVSVEELMKPDEEEHAHLHYGGDMATITRTIMGMTTDHDHDHHGHDHAHDHKHDHGHDHDHAHDHAHPTTMNTHARPAPGS